MVFADGASARNGSHRVSPPASVRATSSRALAELAVGERGGVVIDDHCRTSDPDIYAIGECALWNGRIYGLVAPGYQMARGRGAPSRGRSGCEVPRRRHEHQAEADGRRRGIRSATRIGTTPGALDYVYTDHVAGIYKKLVVSSDGKPLLGAILVGDAADYGTLLQMALNAHAAARASRRT